MRKFVPSSLNNGVGKRRLREAGRLSIVLFLLKYDQDFEIKVKRNVTTECL